MKFMFPAAVIFSAGVFTVQAAAVPKLSHADRMSISSDDDGPVADCSGLHIRFDDKAAVIRSEERSIPASSSPVRVDSEMNGGLQVQGWNKDNYSVTLCKAADPDRKDADQVLSQISLSVEGGRVSVKGPSNHDHWSAYVLVRAPKSATLELHTKNGPLSIYDLDAKLNAHALNGPITLHGFSGEGDITAKNGPIDLSNNSGKLHLHAENGPVEVSLNGDSWKGGGLEADTQNGPLTLKLPQNYRSGVLVESNGHSPMSCHASVCDEARKTWDDEHRRIEFGASPAVIRLSTVNGPVDVQTGGTR
jgi:DUF4097 and DUF4098 domain-containing protein YvlB